MSELKRTLGFKTTELFFQQVITVADMQGLTKSDFVRKAVEAAVEKADTELRVSSVLEQKQPSMRVIEIPKNEIRSSISAAFLQHQKHEFQRYVMLTAGVTKMLQCLPFLIQMGSKSHLAAGIRS